MNQGKVLRVIILIIGQETNANTNSNTSISNNNKINTKRKRKKKTTEKLNNKKEVGWPVLIYSTSTMVAIGVVGAAVFMSWRR